MIASPVSASRRPRELSNDPAFRRRVIRLAVVSAIVLGLITYLADRQSAPLPIVLLLLLGWLTMPTLLLLSLARPMIRVGLLLPSTVVTMGVVWLAAMPGQASNPAGWILVAIGIILGDLLGLWFWFRLIPVPPMLNDPFSPARWTLIAVHIACVVGGLAMLLA